MKGSRIFLSIGKGTCLIFNTKFLGGELAKDEDQEGGFPFGGWQLPFFDDSSTGLAEVMKNSDTLLIGRKTYDIFASFWPTKGKDIEWIGDYMNGITKYVASRRLKKMNGKISIS